LIFGRRNNTNLSRSDCDWKKTYSMKKTAKNDLEEGFQKFCALHKAGRYPEAEKGYRKILQNTPDSLQVLRALGNLYLDQNRVKKAKPVFEKAAGFDPPDVFSCYQLGRLKQLENDHQGAIPLYRRMLEVAPEAGLAWNNLGVAYRETGAQEDAMASFQEAVRFAPGLAAAWNNLGVALDENNQADKALTAYQKAIDMDPAYASPHLNLGILLQKAGRFKAAEPHYRKVLETQPKNEIAQFMLQTISAGDNPPDAAPVAHVRRIFDQCADNFEAVLVDELAYQTPERLFHLVRPYLTENMDILDLGCGTGLGAVLYQPFAKCLTGVDVSEKMLEKAAGKNIYTRLEVFDILEKWTFPIKFDLIYSCDVLVYFGTLDPIVKSAAASLALGGKFAFSVERLKDDDIPYRLYPSGRYAHSIKYTLACLDRHGLKLLKINNTTIRKQAGQPVKGLLIVAEK